jgi:RNA polymerase sigma-70 factor (ECF subfamily)
MIRRSLKYPEEFRFIFQRHFGPICRYLARRVEPATAEDIAAEVFVHAFRHRKVYDPRYPSARPWLFGIATNELRRQRRDEQRRLKAYARAYAGEADEDEDGAVSRGDARAMWPRLALALASLAAKDRDVLLLFAQELSYEEIALAPTSRSALVRSRSSVHGSGTRGLGRQSRGGFFRGGFRGRRRIFYEGAPDDLKLIREFEVSLGADAAARSWQRWPA